MIIPYLVLAFILRTVCSEEIADVKQLLPNPIIGAFFERNSTMRKAFDLAIRTVNKCLYDHEICEIIHPTPVGVNSHFFHQVEFSALAVVAADDSVDLYKQFGDIACLTDEQDRSSGIIDGLAVVMGPHRRLSAIYIQGLCEIHDIPHMIIRRELDFEHDHHRSLNIYPDTETLAKIYIEMLRKLNWTDFSILYERTENLIALDNVLKMFPVKHIYKMYAYKLGSEGNFTDKLLKVKATEHKAFLIDCGFKILDNVLKQLQQVGMMTESYNYIVTTLDLHAVNLYPYQHSGANISGLQLVDVDNPFVNDFISKHLDVFGVNDVKKLRVKDALIFDAVTLFAQAYKDLNYQYRSFQRGARLELDYDKDTLWKDGISLRNYMLATETTGLTGPVMIDGDGVRRRFKLDVMNLHESGLARVGEWNFEDGFSDINLVKSESRTHYRVLISLVDPYAFKVNDTLNRDGNDRYEGFVIDLIQKLSEHLKFDYTFYLQEDKNNGNCRKQQNGSKCTCVGIMDKLLKNEMDLAIADLTITEDRQKCVEFSTAFMGLGISMLFKKPQKAEATWYSFLTPFHYTVWLYMGLTFYVMGVVFYIVARISPGEWFNPYPCIDEPTELHTQFSIVNSLWFSLSSKMQQGSEIMPLSTSVRILAGWWWFFCLIMINNYTANLVAFLTVEKPVEILRDVDDILSGKVDIKYGAKLGGSTLQYFKVSNKYRKLYEQMMDNDWQRDYMVKENKDGVDIAKRTDINYAFFMESVSIEYEVKRNCELQMTGKLLDQKSYAIGFAQNFTEKKKFNEILLMLQESLVIKELKDKWWNMKGATCPDAKVNEASDFTPVTLDQMKGIFYVLGVGLLISLLRTIHEFVRHIRSIPETSELGFWKIAKMELRMMTQSKPIKPVLSKQISLETDSMDGYSNNLTISTGA